LSPFDWHINFRCKHWHASNDIFQELYRVRKQHPNKFISSCLNINSIRYRFCSIKELLFKNIVDLLIIAETKLDQSFPDAQFKVDNFHIWRKDRNGNGGGLVIYLWSDLACDWKKHLECETIKSIAVELLVNGKKWLISGTYRPQAISDNEFINDFTKIYDKISVKFDNIIFLGDLNYDLFSLQKR
jgi:exonuclease III